MCLKGFNIQRLNDNWTKFIFENIPLGKLKVNLLMYPQGLNIQRLTDSQIKFAFEEFWSLGVFALGKFKVNLLMYPKRAKH